jgi:hypothetical protein
MSWRIETAPRRDEVLRREPPSTTLIGDDESSGGKLAGYFVAVWFWANFLNKKALEIEIGPG